MRHFSLIPATEAESLESIDFQSGKFFNELTNAFLELKRLQKADFKKSETRDILSAVIKNHTNLTIDFDFGDFGPAIMVPDVHKNNAMFTSFFQDYFDDKDVNRILREQGQPQRGWVNLTKGTVGGIFEKFVATIYFPVDLIKNPQFSPEELAAVTLHEVGHDFVFLEFISRTVRTNQVLAAVSRGLDNSAGAKEREVILVQAAKALKLKELDAAKLANSPRKTVDIVMLGEAARQARSELGTDIYDNNNFEYLADQFSSRHGAGRYIVTALDKLHRMYGSKEVRSTSAYLAAEAMKLLLLGVAIGTLVALPGLNGILSAIYFGTMGLSMVAMDSDTITDYDRPHARFRRIRNQLVELLKNERLPEDRVQDVKEDIATIDNVLSKMVERDQLFGIIARYVIPSVKARLSQEKLMQELESMAASDLFIKAADLRTMA